MIKLLKIKGDIGNTIKHDNIYNKADDLSIIKKNLRIWSFYINME